jgi:hypothetical protein
LRCALDGVSTSQKKRTLRPRTVVVSGYCSIELKVKEKKLDAYTILLPHPLQVVKYQGSASNLISHGGLYGRTMAGNVCHGITLSEFGLL